MIRAFSFILLVLLTTSASAEPIKLKLSFFSSDRTGLYLGAIKPFVDAVNAEAKGLMEIEVFFSGALGKSVASQPQLVTDGIADLAFIIPGATADKFPDNDVIELSGLYRSQAEASLVYTRLIAANALKGYEDFFVVAAFAVEPVSIHTRKPVASLADLKGLKIRANNQTEVATFEKLGMRAVVMPVNQIAESIGNGSIDGGALPPGALAEYGVARIATYHYIIGAAAPTLALVMNREKFNSLPKQLQDVVRKYSGEWPVEHSKEYFGSFNASALKSFMADPVRKVVFPSDTDRIQIESAFKDVVGEWAARSPRNEALLAMARKELGKVRGGQTP